jgi:hypothetical protein
VLSLAGKHITHGHPRGTVAHMDSADGTQKLEGRSHHTGCCVLVSSVGQHSSRLRKACWELVRLTWYQVAEHDGSRWGAKVRVLTKCSCGFRRSEGSEWNWSAFQRDWRKSSLQLVGGETSAMLLAQCSKGKRCRNSSFLLRDEWLGREWELSLATSTGREGGYSAAYLLASHRNRGGRMDVTAARVPKRVGAGRGGCGCSKGDGTCGSTWLGCDGSGSLLRIFQS